MNLQPKMRNTFIHIHKKKFDWNEISKVYIVSIRRIRIRIRIPWIEPAGNQVAKYERRKLGIWLGLAARDSSSIWARNHGIIVNHDDIAPMRVIHLYAIAKEEKTVEKPNLDTRGSSISDEMNSVGRRN